MPADNGKPKRKGKQISRKHGQSIDIEGPARITILPTSRGNRVQIEVFAADGVGVHRVDENGDYEPESLTPSSSVG